MDLITVKGRENGVELCFSRTAPLEEAEAELKRMVQEHEEFFKRAEVCVSYSGMEFSYFDEVKFEKTVKSLFGKHCDFKRQKFLTKNQLFHSLDKDERICRIVRKSLRSGERVRSRGDIVIYGDVNPGATVEAAGNITVIGALRGTAQINGRGYVFAMRMEPTQIRIGNVYSYSKKGESVGAAVAAAEKGEIILQCL